MRYLPYFLVGGVMLALASAARAAPPNAATLIDRPLAAVWDKAKVTPVAPADDAEFLRRVYLDLTGRIPGVTEARHFLDDKRPDKRVRLIEQLLNSPNYANHFTNVWRALLLPEAATNLQVRLQVASFEAWLRKHLDQNSGYDAIVRELLTAPLAAGVFTKGQFRGDAADPSPEAFFFGKELMPENLAAATARIFLGAKLECAQCHDHPFAHWKRDQFWSLAAFYAGVKRQGPGEFVVPGREDPAKREIDIPGTKRTAKARFPDGKEPEWKDGVGTRETLAAWMTKPDNAYFARATVNRTWGYFFGSGLIDPVDETVGADHPAVAPEVLDGLAKAFAESKFDMKFLIRTIVSSRAYQLSSRAGTDANPEQVKLFARMAVRGLTPEQLFDSVAKATGYQEVGPRSPRGVVFANPGNARAEFLARFGATTDKPTEKQTSILQALTLMNSKLVADATSAERSELLAGVIDAPFLDMGGKIEVLYLATLSRRPTETETARMTKFIDERLHTANSDTERQTRSAEAFADVFWSLLNSGEFLLNH
jgi:hypothetical protein